MDDSHLRDPHKLHGWKRLLLGKGRGVAVKLEALLAGKEVDIAEVTPKPLLPDEDKELRLRRFLEVIDRGIKRAQAGSFGRCGVCAEALSEPVLDEQPWTERCARHAS